MTNNLDKQSFGEAGVVFVAADAVPPAGQFCAVSFVGGGGSITTSFSPDEAPLASTVQTGVSFPDGSTIFTPVSLGSNSSFRTNCPTLFYRSFKNHLFDNEPLVLTIGGFVVTLGGSTLTLTP